MSEARVQPDHRIPSTARAVVVRKRRDLTRIGPHVVRHGDCLAAMAKMKGCSIDVTVTSPPYNIALGYNSYEDDRSEEEYLAWMERVAASVKRVLKDDGSFFLNISGSNRKPWLPFLIAARLRGLFALQNHFVWVKSITVDNRSTGHFKPISGRRFTHHNHEHVFHFTKTGNVPLDRLSIGVPFADKSNIARFGHKLDLRCRGNTWFIPYQTVNSRRQKFAHPATFPLELPLWCINLHGRSDATVLDPFLGTGSTLVAAQYAGCAGTGIELDGAYAATAVERVRESLADSFPITLDIAERAMLLEPPPEGPAPPGMESLLAALADRLNKSTGRLMLRREEARRIARQTNDAQGDWAERLHSIFARPMETEP